jgi:riboflavin kinase/FMN adenylyltransferase
MEIHQGHRKLNLNKPVVAIGVFDGVHRGHRSLISEVVEAAEKERKDSLIITFKQHPRHVLAGGDMPLLTTTDEKISLMGELGVGHVLLLDFDREFSNTSACDFVTKTLAGEIGAGRLILGYDQRIGRNGEGDYSTIRQCTDDITIVQSESVIAGGIPISSSAIRTLLLAGDIDGANELLGYNYSLSGEVIRGRMIGRSLGFPTANIRIDDTQKLIPVNGVYAVGVELNGIACKGMMSIGTNPTVNKSPDFRSIEVNIFDFSRDIYGQKIIVRFRKRLRDEIKFQDVMQLAAQMDLYRRNALEVLK